MSSSNIENQFRKAGIPVRVVSEASQVSSAFALGKRRVRDSNDDVFLMDILTTRKGEEQFVINPGAADVQVPSIDPKRQQAVLFVRERARTIRFNEYNYRERRNVERVVHEPETKRHFLVGMDETHLFACPLSRGVSSVDAAHRTLAPEDIHEARRKGSKVPRQGEFFFIPATATEIGQIEEVGYAIQAKQPLGPRGRRGRPHLVDEKVYVGRRIDYSYTPIVGRYLGPNPRRVASEGVEFARGSVRHPEHRVLVLKGWHRVVLNTEATAPGSRPSGMTWVD